MGSEATAAADNQAAIRRDPMAMLPFCGYHMADYWRHWLELGERLPAPPKIFRVNWFRKNAQGKFLWPGFGQNTRVLEWIIDRVKGRADAAKSPFGYLPEYDDLNWNGLAFDRGAFRELMLIDKAEAKREAADQRKFFDKFGARLPAEMERQRQAFAARLEQAPDVWVPATAHDNARAPRSAKI
jgi:phosphoenolpyruvate carboxykinase (GTP)